MRKFIGSAAVAAIFLLAHSVGTAAAAAPTRSSSGSIVIVFKDGHRQSFNLSDIDRVEFPGAAAAGNAGNTVNPDAPPRGHYIGKWECGDGNGGTFYIDLKENGQAMRSIGDVRGRWDYVNGEAHITWDDGAQDALRKVGSHYQKSAYRAGKSFSDKPDNVANARLTNPKPI